MASEIGQGFEEWAGKLADSIRQQGAGFENRQPVSLAPPTQKTEIKPRYSGDGVYEMEEYSAHPGAEWPDGLRINIKKGTKFNFHDDLNDYERLVIHFHVKGTNSVNVFFVGLHSLRDKVLEWVTLLWVNQTKSEATAFQIYFHPGDFEEGKFELKQSCDQNVEVMLVRPEKP